jgi:hypothetical protein
MPEHWDFYLTRLGDHPASVFGNFGLAAEIPRPARPWLLRVQVEMKSPDEHGLSSRDEAEALYEMEDALVPAVTSQCDAELVGRITIQGRREFYFYAANPDPLDLAAGGALAPLGYAYDADAKDDADWGFYANVIYPSEWDWQVMGNRSVLQSLEQSGDDLTQPRRIHHYVHFPTEAARTAFAAAARPLGFGTRAIPRRDDKPDDPRPFPLHVHRIDPVDQPALDDVVYELFSLAKPHDGEYAGWETQVVKPGETPREDAPPEED